MRLLILHTTALIDDTTYPHSAISELPTKKELAPLTQLCQEILPEDPTPSLAEIMARPDVPPLAEPQPAPQPLPESLRVIVQGTDATLSTVLTRLMRADTMWVEVGYVPTNPDSPVARLWGLPTDPQEAFDFACNNPSKPKPLIRDDKGIAVAGQATISDWEHQELTGEIIVDSQVVMRQQAKKSRPRGHYGAILESTNTAPGIAAWEIISSLESQKKRWYQRKPLPAGSKGATLYTGRAMQGGGPSLRVTVDGIPRKRPNTSATFYRHLRDLQAVRA